MTQTQTLNELARIHTLLTALIEDLDESGYRDQFHPDLSALGWHLGHCAYVECYWLHEVVRGDGSVTQPLRDLYVPPITPKPERGKLIPPREQLLAWTEGMFAFNRDLLTGGYQAWTEHALLKDEYLQHFLIQHHSQHYETMMMALTQRALGKAYDFDVSRPLQATPASTRADAIPAGHYRIGGLPPVAFDNELPPQKAQLGPYAIARQPVSNSEFLGFMVAGGYLQQALWSEAGWQWREQQQADHPDHWRQNARGDWFGIGIRGPYQLTDSDPVTGINRFEAEAFANWAGARLPHEYQWEVACRLGILENTGRVWEWCDNTFFPYAGFETFPYDEYSKPWFDGRHYLLRGGSLYTQPGVRRPSFRNFYEADKRHIFAGLRLVFDTDS